MTTKSPIATIIAQNDLPEQFSFLDTTISQLLSKIYLTEHYVGYSKDGSTISHALLLETNDAFGFEIPGLGLKLIVNPSPTGTSSFTFNLSVYKGK